MSPYCFYFIGIYIYLRLPVSVWLYNTESWTADAGWNGPSLIEARTRQRERLWVSFASTWCVKKNTCFHSCQMTVRLRVFHHPVLSLSLVRLPLQPTQWLPLIGHIYLWLPRQPLALVVWRGGSLTNKLYLPWLPCSVYLSVHRVCAHTHITVLIVCVCPCVTAGKKGEKKKNRTEQSRW